MRIGELLVQGGFITAPQLEAALTAQQIYGGRLGTNLVEQGLVTELDLARALSTQMGIRLVGRDTLARVHPEILALIPVGVAQKYGVVPFGRDESSGRVFLAMADPANLEKVDQIQFRLGKRVELFICPEIVLASSLERYYGVKRQLRFIKLQVDGPAVAKSARPAPPATGRAPGPSTGRRRAAASEDVLAPIIGAGSTEELLISTLDILSSFAGQSLFLAVRGETLNAWQGRGLAASADQLARSAVPLAASPVVQRILGDGAPVRCALTEDPLLIGLLGEQLFFDDSEGIFLLPLPVGGRLFGLFALGGLRPEVFPREPGPLVELMRRVDWRLQALQLMERVAAPLADLVG